MPAADPIRFVWLPPDRNTPGQDRDGQAQDPVRATPSAPHWRHPGPAAAHAVYAESAIRYGGMRHVSRPKPRHMTAHAFGGCLMKPRREEIAAVLKGTPAGGHGPGPSRWHAGCGRCRTTGGRHLSGAPALGQQFTLAHRAQRATARVAVPGRCDDLGYRLLRKSHQSRPGSGHPESLPGGIAHTRCPGGRCQLLDLRWLWETGFLRCAAGEPWHRSQDRK